MRHESVKCPCCGASTKTENGIFVYHNHTLGPKAGEVCAASGKDFAQAERLMLVYPIRTAS